MQTDQKNVIISNGQKDPNAVFSSERQFNKKRFIVLYQFNCKAGGVGRQVTKLKVPFGPKEGVPDRLQASK